MATAGCPWTDRLRPMARFHLPFANEAETVYRSVSMYLLSREMTGAPTAARPSPDSRALREPAHRQQGHVPPTGRRDQHRSGAQRDRAARLLHDALARGTGASLEELKPLFDAWQAE